MQSQSLCRIVLLCVVLFLLGSDCERARIASFDNGLMNRDGVELHVCSYPITIDADVTLEDRSVLTDAVVVWNDWTDFDVFVFGSDDPDAMVSVGFAGYEDELDLTTVDFDRTGCILECSIILSADIAYDRSTLRQALLHSMGHCLGLDDDPGPPETVDLRSVMSKPLDPLGVLTDHDLELL